MLYLAIACLFHFAAGAQHTNRAEGSSMNMLDSLQIEAGRYAENHPVEKVYVHTDKPFYVAGETSWYKAYVVSGPDLRTTEVSGILYVDWIDPEGNIIRHQRLKIDSGSAVGDFMIGRSVPPGTYTMRAYTQWMRNEDPALFFSRSIPIVNITSAPAPNPTNADADIDLQFLPEGGTLVIGIKTQMAFKATDGQGNGIEVRGHIIDEQQNVVTAIKSTHNGMGVFPFIPQKHKSYRARLDNGGEYALPVAKENGFILMASNMKPEKLLVEIHAGPSEVGTSAYLIGQSGGSVCYAAWADIDRDVKSISISKHELPDGVLQLTLFDHRGIPQCERKVFIKKDSKVSVTISSDKTQYDKRDLVVLDLKVNDPKGNPIATSLSVSVTDAALVGYIANSGNIYTQLMLQSDLKGHVQDPGWYFDAHTSERTYALDLVMLTHGWSRYHWTKHPHQIRDSVTFMPETGIVLKGRIFAQKKAVVNAPFTLVIPQEGPDFVNVYESDSVGTFLIPGLEFSDTATLSWRVMSGKKGKVQNATIELDSINDIPGVDVHLMQYPIPTSDGHQLLEKLRTRRIAASDWLLDSATVLDEVVVTGERTRIRNVGMGAIAVRPTGDELKLGTSQFINRYAIGLSGAKLVRVPPDTELWTTPGGGPIVISVNGYVRDDTGFAPNPYVVLSSVPIEQIQNVIIAGDPHNGYFIDITTSNEYTLPRIESTKMKAAGLGYEVIHEFYHPKYESPEARATGRDNRTTLYWNAGLQTNKTGKATFRFFNSDFAREFLVVVEGIANGQVISFKKVTGKK